MKYKVLTEKQVNQLESAMNSGWELMHTVATDRLIVFVLKKAK